MRRASTVAALLCLLALTALVSSAPGGAQPAPPPTADQVESIALAHLADVRASLGLSSLDIADVAVTTVALSSDGGVNTVHLVQRVGGVEIQGATMSIVVSDSREVLDIGNRFVPGGVKLTRNLSPAIDATEAAERAAVALGLTARGDFDVQSSEGGPDQEQKLDEGGIAAEEIPARLVLQRTESGSVRLAWELVIVESSDDDVWQILIDAVSGQELDRKNKTRADSYRVFEEPTEAPIFGNRTLVVDPADPTASPFGWHDTDGVAGAESTLTIGNNVTAYLDTNADQQPDPGSQPDGGASLVFDFVFDPTKPPIDNADAAVTNLFYWTNLAHDVLYAYGFDEASGNFQTNNYGNGGVGGDAVRAETQDGLSNNNGNMFTPPDGSPPRMQLYPFNFTTPERDPGFDASIIVHEYVHGLTDRLTGGPANVTCLDNDEAMGEGWSDWFALMFTMGPGDVGATPRGFAPYLLGQSTSGGGFRSWPYSTNTAVNPTTYATITTASLHDRGAVWAQMLWDMTWALIERDGFDADLIGGTGGNNTALQLVVDALKLQPCSPGFVDARDAVLLADTNLTSGANQCLIWEAFAARGLGFSADQVNPNDETDGVEAFDLPAECTDLAVAIAATPTSPEPGTTVTYDVTLDNTGATPLTGVTATVPVPAGAVYDPASATCAGSEAGGVVTMAPGAIGVGGSIVCSFTVTVNGGPGTLTRFTDDIESGAGAWTVSHLAGTADWATSTAQSNSPSTSFFAANPSAVSDQILATTAPVTVSAQTELRFWHNYTTENTFDGGVVEVSTDGVGWTDIGPLFTTNGYPNLLNAGSNPLAGRLAFTGDSGGWIESVADLSAFAGSDLFIRFRFGSDTSVGEVGWYVDDISVVDPVELTTTATGTSTEGPNDQDTITTAVAQSTAPALLRVTTNPAVPSVIERDGLWTDAFGIDWVELPSGSAQVCFSDVPGFTSPPCENVSLINGVTTVVPGTFITHGTLNIVSSPAVATTISVDGNPVNDWGAIVSIEPGSYEICFGLVSGWDPPACQTVAVTAGNITNVTGVFTANGAAPGDTGFGQLRVTTNPPVRSQILVDGYRATSFGMDWMKLQPGSYEVCFSDVPGYATPSCQTAVVVDGVTSVVQGDFTQLAELRVITSPPAGAPITVDGRVVDQYGFWTWVPAGVSYEICTVGYACQTVNPPAGSLSTVTLVPGP